MKALARHTFWVFGLTMMVASMMLVGCGSNDGGGGAPPVVIAPGPGISSCLAGQVNTAYGCLYTSSCQSIYPGFGWLPGENRCVPPLPGSTGSLTSGVFLASLSIQKPKTFALMLQNFGLCSPYVIGINLGNANCDNYTQAGYMSLQAVGATGTILPAQGNVVIGAGASFPTQPNSNWITGGTVLRPSFSSPLAPANGNAGFTGTGPYGFRFVVNQGLPGNSYQMSVSLMYNNEVFATGNLIAQ